MRKVIWLKTMWAWVKFWKRTTLWEFKKEWHRILEKCICECWTVKFVARVSLLNWKSTSCSCYKMPSLWINKWDWRTRFYNIWHDLWHRCYDPNRDKYYKYWWRWIKVIRKDYWEFKEDMYESYLKHVEEFWEKETTIDRIDVNWNYCKENCRRATKKEQANNRTTCKRYTFNWVTKNIKQRAEYINMKRWFVRTHLLKWEDIGYIEKLWKELNVKPFN